MIFEFAHASMKQNILILLVLCFTGLQAQTDSIVAKDPRRPSYPHMNRNTYLETEMTLYGLSNQLSLNQINTLLNDDFLDNAEKDAFLGSINSKLRYGYFREISFTYRKPAVEVFDQMRPGQGFRISNKYIQSASIDRNTLDLIFYGNKPYEDQTIDFGPSAFQTWYYTSLDYLYDIRLDTLQTAEISVGILLGHDHSAYDLENGSLYTAKDGEYLDAVLDYSIRDQARESLVLNGLGLALGFNTAWNWDDNKSLYVEARDLGIIYWNKGFILDTDSSFRFTGAGFDNILNISDSITDGLGDQYRSAFFYEEESNYLTLLPFSLNAEFRIHRKRVLQDLRAGLDYYYLPGYLPRLYAGMGFLLTRNALFNVEASTGGYNPYRLDAGIKVRLGYNWELVANAFNLTQLILVNEPGGSGGYLRLRYRI